MGNCASAPGAAPPSEHHHDVGAGSCVGGPSTGALVLLTIDPLVLARANSSSSSQQCDGTHYMVRTDGWHSFSAAGFLVEAQVGLGGACVFDVLITFPAADAPSCLLLEHAASLDGGGGNQQPLNSSTQTLRLRWDTLQRTPGVTAIALAPPAAPLSTTEAARVKAFAASLAAPHDPPEDLGRRARLLSSRGRKVFLPVLIGEMLVAAGQLQRSGEDLYSARKQSWMMPDLHFVPLPLAQQRSLPLPASAPWSAAEERATATSSLGPRAVSSLVPTSSHASSTAAAAAAAKAPSRQARREQQARALQQHQPTPQQHPHHQPHHQPHPPPHQHLHQHSRQPSASRSSSGTLLFSSGSLATTTLTNTTAWSSRTSTLASPIPTHAHAHATGGQVTAATAHGAHHPPAGVKSASSGLSSTSIHLLQHGLQQQQQHRQASGEPHAAARTPASSASQLPDAFPTLSALKKRPLASTTATVATHSVVEGHKEHREHASLIATAANTAIATVASTPTSKPATPERQASTPQAAAPKAAAGRGGAGDAAATPGPAAEAASPWCLLSRLMLFDGNGAACGSRGGDPAADGKAPGVVVGADAAGEASSSDAGNLGGASPPQQPSTPHVLPAALVPSAAAAGLSGLSAAASGRQRHQVVQAA